MKAILFTLLLMFNYSHAADSFSVEVQPRNPMAGDVFQILFKCKITGSNEPQINFESDGFDVSGKQVQGVSTRTIYQGGKINVTKELIVSFDARANQVGISKIKNIRVSIDGKTSSSEDINIRIVKTPPEPKVVFIAAEVSKNDVYLNEGIIVRYHLYKKVGLQAFDIKKYPKLDGFMKRYLQENENTQRVNIDGEIFGKSTIYSARIFPEKIGKLIIDPMDVSAVYSRDSFGSFGFGFGGISGRDEKSKILSSEPIEINVKALPIEGKPQNFSGLIGKHQLDVRLGRTNILVNEPLDVKVSISGEGNLEMLTLPDIWDSNSLEKFDVKIDLSLVGADSAIKTYDYTYLGKANAELRASDYKVSYFDPVLKKYDFLTFPISAIKIAGDESPVIDKKPKTSLSIPLKEGNGKENIQVIVASSSGVKNIFLKVLAFLLISVFVFKAYEVAKYNYRDSGSELMRDYKKLRSGNVNYGILIKFLSNLNTRSNLSIKERINGSDLSHDAKQYFVNLIADIDNREFGKIKDGIVSKIDKKMLKELYSLIKATNESR